MPIMKRGRLSSARPKRTLLSIDKNYARRIETLYRKAFEAPRVITDEATRDRCRLAVIQELDGVCSVFLTHNDESWPPSRDQLNKFEVLKPEHYDTWSHANGALTRGADGEVSEDEGCGPRALTGSIEAGAHQLWETIATPPPTKATHNSLDHFDEACLNPAVLCTPPSEATMPARLDDTPRQHKTTDPSTLVTPPRRALPGAFALRTPPSQTVSTPPHQSMAADSLTKSQPPVSPSPRRRPGIWRMRNRARESQGT